MTKCASPNLGYGILSLAVLSSFGTPAIAQDGGIDPASLRGILQDDSAAKVEGTWSKSTHTKPFLGVGYQYASGGEGQKVTFSVEIEEAGEYQVLLSYTPGPNRTEKGAVIIRQADNEKIVYVNQMRKPDGPYSFHPLGEFRFEPGTVDVVVSAEGNKKGVVIADGIQLLKPDEFKLAVEEAPKKPPKLLAALKKPAATEKKEETPPAEKPPQFVRKASAKPVARLTPQQLDELLDKYVGGILAAQGIDDEAYLRRVSLDLIGRQPTLAEREAFLADDCPDKRAKRVEQLLASPEFGENWANYLSDIISYRTPQPELTFLNYTPLKQWLAERFNDNAGWDEISYELVTAIGKVGENPAATYIGFHQGDKSRLASETTRIFLSTQIQCAECHDHKFVDMPQETFHHVAAFFVRVEAKLPWNDSSAIIVGSKAKGEHKMPEGKSEMEPIAFSSRKVGLGASDVARRVELADWIVSPENPWFAKAFTNRVWARLLGRGFCEPVDEIGELGDRILPEVHAAVADHFIASQFDVKELFRLVVLSKSYSRGIADGDAKDAKPFAVIPAGRLRGDEVYDSLAVAIELPNVTPPQEKATDAIRFPPPPKSTRDLVNDAFGFDPSSEASNVVRTMQQAMLLMNNEQIQKQINADPASGTVLAKLLMEEKDDAAAVVKLYQRVLGRKPTDKESAIAAEHIAGVGKRGAAFEDLLWSLVNSAEFVARR
ncbi:MAG TPA: DUF1549 domain-containing protein [Pirellulaceae bacterium]|nr:DUF1549 domain-containing protein [Pirellulaceae bacterium]